jgi:predicted DNA-binding transcriptional regulator AlpA
VRAEHVPRIVGLSAATVWRRRQAGQFPPAIRLGDHAIGFRRGDLERWLREREIPTEAGR